MIERWVASFFGFVFAVSVTRPAPCQSTEGPSHRVFGAAPDVASTPATPAGTTRVWARLEYSRGPGAETCPDEQGLRNIVASRVGHDPFGPSGPVVVRVFLAKQGAGYVATVEKRDLGGKVLWTRPPFADPDCSRVADLAQISIVSAILPVGEQAPSQPAPPPTVIVVSPAAVPTNPAPQPAPASSSGPRVLITASGGVAFGTAPNPTAAVSVGAGARWKSFSLLAEARADVPSTSTVLPNVQLRSSLIAGSVVPCGHLDWFIVCAVVTIGGLQMHVSGSQVTGATDQTGAYVGVGARAGAEWLVTKGVALRALGELLVAPGPVVARIDSKEIWRTPPVSGTLGLGAVATF